MGYEHPDDLLPRLTSRQWADWLAFFALEPFGPRRDDERAGVLATVMANSQRDPKRKPFEPGDFFPEIAPEPMPLKMKLRATFDALRMRARKR